MEHQGSWAVEYHDGSIWSQYDEQGAERPYSSINWSRAKRLRLESQDFSQIYDVYPAPPEYQLSMRGRAYMTMAGDRLFVYMVVLSLANAEVNDATTLSVLYWLPTGIEHHCWKFDCPDVRKYAHGFLKGESVTLMPEHGTPAARADALLVCEE